MTENIESRFSVFKRSLSEEYEALVPSAGKRFKKCDIEFKSKGNKKQFDHQQLVLEKLAEAKDSLAIAKYDKSKAATEEGIILAETLMKATKLADRSEFGCSTVNEYLSHELAYDSEDERQISRSGKRADRRSKQVASHRRNWALAGHFSKNFNPSGGSPYPLVLVPKRAFSNQRFLEIGSDKYLCLSLILAFDFIICLILSFALLLCLPSYFSAMFTLIVLVSRGT